MSTQELPGADSCRKKCLEDNRSIAQLASEIFFIRPVMGWLQKLVKHCRRQKSVFIRGDWGS